MALSPYYGAEPFIMAFIKTQYNMSIGGIEMKNVEIINVLRL